MMTAVDPLTTSGKLAQAGVRVRGTSDNGALTRVKASMTRVVLPLSRGKARITGEFFARAFTWSGELPMQGICE